MDQYVKGATLGQGTFGVVFKATHKEVFDIAQAERMSCRGTVRMALHLAYRLGKLSLSKRSTWERPKKVSMSLP